MLDTLRRYLGVKTIWVKCGAFACDKVFEVREGDGKPDIYVCKSCEYKVNEGIVQYVHANSGKLKGNFHLIDGYSKG